MKARAGRLSGDARGMLMVLAVPLAAVLAACLWYLAGIGDALLYRERLQDAADATAFESAVLHARGMNGVAMLNILQALLLASLCALRGGNVLAVAGGLATLSAGDRALSDRAVDTMVLVSRIQEGVAAATPVLATVRSASDSALFYRAERAADDVVSVSHALLPTRVDDRLTVHPRAPWSLDDQVAAPAPHRLGARALAGQADVLPSLPVATDDSDRLCREAAARVDVSDVPAQRTQPAPRAKDSAQLASALCARVPPPARMFDGAENGNVLLQVWAAAERAMPSSRVRFFPREEATAEAPLATAQAEFFFACSSGHEAWRACRHDALWTLGWSARMRRVWSPTSSLAAQVRPALHSALDHADTLTRQGLAGLRVHGTAQRGKARSGLTARQLFDALERGARAGWIH